MAIKDKLNNSEMLQTTTPISGMLYFFVLSIFYIIISVILIYTSVATPGIEIALNIIFVLLLILGLYFINLKTITQLCGNGDSTYIPPYQKVMTTTFIPWIIVFGSIFLILETFPGWVSPFSNTLGYLIIKFLGADDTYKSILKTEQEIKKNQNIASAIKKMSSDTSMFINDLHGNQEDFENDIKLLKKEGFLNFNEDNVMNNESVKILFKLVQIKNTIGKGIWYILAGGIVASISYNIILDINCQKSPDQASKLIDNKENEDYLMEGTLWKVITDTKDDELLGKEPIESDNLSKLFVYDSENQIANFKYELINETIYSQNYNSNAYGVQIRLENTYSMEDIYSNQYVSLTYDDFVEHINNNYTNESEKIMNATSAKRIFTAGSDTEPNGSDKICYLVIE